MIGNIKEFSKNVTSTETKYRCVSGNALIEAENNRGRHFVALVESLSCPRVRIWAKQTQPKTQGGRQKRGLFGKRME